MPLKLNPATCQLDMVMGPGSGTATVQFDIDAATGPGTDPALPTAGGAIDIAGAVVAAHSVPVETHSRAANGFNVEVQVGAAVTGAPGNKDAAGLVQFDDTAFAVDADGYVTMIGGGSGIEQFTPDSGTSPVIPDGGGDVDLVGDGSITTVGGTNSLTVQLTGLTNHAILAGAGSTTITKIGPNAATGLPLISQGASSDPVFGTATVPGGGTGAATLTGVLTGNGTSAFTANAVTQYGVLVGGASNAVDSTAVGTAGDVLTSNGAGLAPTYQTPTVGTVTSVSGTSNRISSTGGATPVIDIDAAYVGQASITTLGTIGTGTWEGTDVGAAHGGTGRSSHTAYAVICGGTTTTGAQQSIASVGTAGQVLTSNGAGALPTMQDAAGGGLTWNEETGTSATMAVDNGYIANNASLVTLTLPTTAAVGDIVAAVGKGAGLFKIAQNASEIIHFIDTDTTTGTGGSLTAIEQYASIELICTVANTEWTVRNSTGNYTVV